MREAVQDGLEAPDSPPERVVIHAEDGLELRQLVEEDAGPMKATMDYDRPHLLQHGEPTGNKYKTEQEIIDSLTDPKNANRLRMGIWQGDKFVGSVNLTSYGEQGVIGYWVGKEFIGQGIAAKATRALSSYAFEQGYKLLLADVHPDNEASKKTLENSGFVFGHASINKEGEPILIYKKTNNEQRPQRG